MVMRLAATGERGMKAGDAGRSAFLQPCDQLVAPPNTKAAEVEDLQPSDALQSFQVIIE